MNEYGEAERRLLVIDDNESIHEDFKKILSRDMSASTSVDEAAAALFDEPDSDIFDGADGIYAPSFEIDTACQGQDGLALVEKAVNEGRPYAMAFVDVRMPPGWDGIETTARIWEVDPRIQIVICTAYSDYSADEILKRFGVTDRLLILRKPFDSCEALFLAATLSEKWNLVRAADTLNQILAKRAFA